MKNSDIQTQKIINYLQQELNPHEKKVFEHEMAQNLELQKEVRFHEMVNEGIGKEIKVEAFRMKLNNIHEKEFGKPKTKVLNLQNKWYWAAASITVFSGTAVYSLLKTNFSNDKLFNKYYDVWQPALTTRGIENERNLTAIYQNFESKKYIETLQSIEKLDANTLNSPKIQLLKGCTLMELNRFSEAIEVFNYFETGNYTLYTDAGQWYKALCYLKIDDTQNAQQLLINMIDEENSYSKEASELLKKLK